MAILIANQSLTQLEFLLDPEVDDYDDAPKDPNVIPDVEEVIRTLNEISYSVGYGGPNVRESMLERGAYATICKAWKLCCWSGVQDVTAPSLPSLEARDAVLLALYALTAGFPETIDEIGWEIVAQAVDKTASEQTQILVLKVIRNACIKSEENREHFTWNLGLFDPMLSLVIIDNPSSEFIREWCATTKTILLSDDVRVPFNRAPERKRMVADSGILPILANFLHKPEFEKDEGALNAIIILLGTMAVNEDWCLHIESGNVLPGIYSTMKNHFRNKTLLRNSISLLRYLAGNEAVREKYSGFPFMKWVIEVINYYKKEADVVDVAVSCMAFMTLKNACQCSQFVNKNGLPLLMNTMRDFNKDITILKGACLTLRNVCENADSEGRENIIKLGYATVFSQLLADVPELKEYHIMPILRELGLDDLAALGYEGEEEEEEGEGSAPRPPKPINDKAFLLQGEESGEEGMVSSLLAGMGL